MTTAALSLWIIVLIFVWACCLISKKQPPRF